MLQRKWKKSSGCDVLCDLVPFVQFFPFFKLYKWYPIAQNVSFNISETLFLFASPQNLGAYSKFSEIGKVPSSIHKVNHDIDS